MNGKVAILSSVTPVAALRGSDALWELVYRSCFNQPETNRLRGSQPKTKRFQVWPFLTKTATQSFMTKESLRQQMTEAYESVMILDAQTKITMDMARLGVIPKHEAIRNIENALVEVKALRERHIALRQLWEKEP